MSSSYLVFSFSENEFTCSTGRCIPKDFKCDADNDCGDFSGTNKNKNKTSIASQMTTGPSHSYVDP